MKKSINKHINKNLKIKKIIESKNKKPYLNEDLIDLHTKLIFSNFSPIEISEKQYYGE